MLFAGGFRVKGFFLGGGSSVEVNGNGVGLSGCERPPSPPDWVLDPSALFSEFFYHLCLKRRSNAS